MSTRGARAHEQDRFGDLLGASDFLPIERQLDLALGLIAELHLELGRTVRLANAYRDEVASSLLRGVDSHAKAEPGRIRRIRSAWARRRSLGFVGYLRTVAWILFKSATTKTGPKIAAPSATIPPELISKFVGDRPIRSRLKSRDYDEAHVLIRALLPVHGGNPKFLVLAREIETKRGSISAVLALTNSIAKTQKVTPESVRTLEGRLREISGWYPNVPGPLVPMQESKRDVIVHLCKESRPYLSNGFTTRSQRNFEAMESAGLKTVVITEPGFPRSVGVEDPAERVWVDGVEHRHIDLGPNVAKSLPFDAFHEVFAREAYRIVDEVRPSVIHVSSGRRGYDTPLVGIALKQKTGLPLVYEFRSFFEGTWTPDTEYAERGEIFRRRMAVERMCLEAADSVITLSESMSAELVRMGCAEDKIFIVPNGVDVERFSPRPRSQKLAQRYQLDGVITFGYVSNMDHPRESQETLIRAQALLRERGLRTKCVLVGDGQRRKDLVQLAVGLGVEDSTIFTGGADHEEILDYYSLIDLFVVPRTDERAGRLVTPLKPFEAMAMEIPLIVSDVPALRELVDPTRGFTFPVDDQHELAATIAGLIDEPSVARAAAVEAARWVRTERRWDLNGERYRKAFDYAKEHAAR